MIANYFYLITSCIKKIWFEVLIYRAIITSTPTYRQLIYYFSLRTKRSLTFCQKLLLTCLGLALFKGEYDKNDNTSISFGLFENVFFISVRLNCIYPVTKIRDLLYWFPKAPQQICYQTCSLCRTKKSLY